MVGTPMGFRIATPDIGTAAGLGVNATGGNAAALGDMQPKGVNLPMMRPDDLQYFDKLLQVRYSDQERNIACLRGVHHLHLMYHCGFSFDPI